MELRYKQSGDYLFPEMGLTERERKPVGKFGMMRQQFLWEHRPVLYTQLLLSGKLMDHLREVDSTCRERLELLISQLKQTEGITEQLKAENQLEWVRRMNGIRNRAEEIVLAELIFD